MSHDGRGRGFLLLGTGDEQRCRLESGNEQGRSKSSLKAGIGRFMNQKGMEKPLTEVEGRRTLDGSLMKGLSFRTGDKILRELHHGSRPLEFAFERPPFNRIHGANALRKKG